MYARNEEFPVAQDIAARGISLPSYPQLSANDMARTVEALEIALRWR
jgi:perosamine synthetase